MNTQRWLAWSLIPLLCGAMPAWAEEFQVTQEVQTDIMTQTPLNEPQEDETTAQKYDEMAENDPAAISDPIEPVNRAVFTFNEALSRIVLRPIARTYVKVAPQPVRTGVGNFLSNLFYPKTIANDFLQGKFQQGVSDTGRFLVNLVIGFGGIFDPAREMGMLPHGEDFGQTLGYWGVSPGPYLVLPLLGPASVRDTVGRVVDYPFSPLTYVHEPDTEFAIGAVGAVNATANLLQLDRMLEESFDPYAFQRGAYSSFREAAVKR